MKLRKKFSGVAFLKYSVCAKLFTANIQKHIEHLLYFPKLSVLFRSMFLSLSLLYTQTHSQTLLIELFIDKIMCRSCMYHRRPVNGHNKNEKSQLLLLVFGELLYKTVVS